MEKSGNRGRTRVLAMHFLTQDWQRVFIPPLLFKHFYKNENYKWEEEASHLSTFYSGIENWDWSTAAAGLGQVFISLSERLRFNIGLYSKEMLSQWVNKAQKNLARLVLNNLVHVAGKNTNIMLSWTAHLQRLPQWPVLASNMLLLTIKVDSCPHKTVNFFPF